MHHNVEDHILSKLRNSEPDGVSDLDVGWLCASGKWSWWRWCVIVNRKEDCILNPEPWPPPWPRSSLTPLPQTLSLAVGCASAGFPLQLGSHHFTSTWSLCGPENRPNPLGPRWHQVTHIVRFATHLAQKSNIWTSQSSKKGTSVNCSNSLTIAINESKRQNQS